MKIGWIGCQGHFRDVLSGIVQEGEHPLMAAAPSAAGEDMTPLKDALAAEAFPCATYEECKGDAGRFCTGRGGGGWIF